jgi:Flp pilus assembly protein TadG
MLWLKRVARDTGGQEIAEAAFVLPILFLLVFGILWFARAYSVYTTLNQAANAAAVAAASSTCASCGNQPMTSADVQTKIVNPILSAARLDTTLVTMTMQPPPAFQLNTNSPVANGVVVDLSYPFGFRLNGVVTGLTIRAEARALQEN